MLTPEEKQQLIEKWLLRSECLSEEDDAMVLVDMVEQATSKPSPDKVREILEQFNGILNESQIDYIVKEICGEQ